MAHHTTSDGATGPGAGWLVPGALVAVLSFGLLGLRAMGMTFVGALGTAGLFLLGMALGVGCLAFTGMAVGEWRRGDRELAAEDAEIGRRFAVCGVVFLVGMAVVTVFGRLAPTAIASA